jgi:hypothetical protein
MGSEEQTLTKPVDRCDVSMCQLAEEVNTLSLPITPQGPERASFLITEKSRVLTPAWEAKDKDRSVQGKSPSSSLHTRMQ